MKLKEFCMCWMKNRLIQLYYNVEHYIKKMLNYVKKI